MCTCTPLLRCELRWGLSGRVLPATRRGVPLDTAPELAAPPCAALPARAGRASTATRRKPRAPPPPPPRATGKTPQARAPRARVPDSFRMPRHMVIITSRNEVCVVVSRARNQDEGSEITYDDDSAD